MKMAGYSTYSTVAFVVPLYFNVWSGGITCC